MLSDQCLHYKTIGKLLIIPNLGIPRISSENWTLFDGDAPFSGHRFLLFFFWNRVLKESNFSGAGCQNMSKGEVFRAPVIILSHFCVLEYTFHRFFLESDIISKQNFWSRVKNFFSWAHPRTNLGQVPSPGLLAVRLKCLSNFSHMFIPGLGGTHFFPYGEEPLNRV